MKFWKCNVKIENKIQEFDKHLWGIWFVITPGWNYQARQCKRCGFTQKIDL